ncbi:spore germination protein (amino acid permease) [Paenibacillus taihuensis]|uniref:Spore germination protein (Amino acid permease) n=1 Tax=Paenibacillus taihuensis TaxID=1156355 RepID=A0A3D9RSY1_9BACL|nr:endospore germination permease [Paenibacillus taihuensis]REE80226.1 spore germination protein (amino acid permease) [Paenibacillus taihuensis]
MKVKSLELGFWPVFMMLTLSVGLSAHVLVLPTVLEVSGRDSWMCGLIGFAIVLPWTAIFVTGTMKRTKQINLREWLRTRVSPFGAWLIIIPVIIVLLHSSFQTFIETVAWTSSTYLPDTPLLVIMLSLLLLTGFAVYSGLRAIAYMSCLLLPAVVVLGDFVMSANMPYKNYSLLLPMLEGGWTPALHGSLYAISCLMELAALLFIQHHLKGRIKHWQMVLQLAFITMLMLGPTIGALTEFGPAEADKLLFPAFAQWRLVTIGKYIEHVDFFAIYQWLSGAFVRVSLGIVITLELLQIRKPLHKAIFILVICIVYMVLATLLLTSVNASETAIRYVFAIDICVFGLITTLIWMLSFKGVPKEGGADENQKPKQEDGAINNL